MYATRSVPSLLFQRSVGHSPLALSRARWSIHPLSSKQLTPSLRAPSRVAIERAAKCRNILALVACETIWQGAGGVEFSGVVA